MARKVKSEVNTVTKPTKCDLSSHPLCKQCNPEINESRNNAFLINEKITIERDQQNLGFFIHHIRTAYVSSMAEVKALDGCCNEFHEVMRRHLCKREKLALIYQEAEMKHPLTENHGAKNCDKEK